MNCWLLGVYKMSNSFLVLPNSYAKNNYLNTKIIDNTPYYERTKELIDLLADVGALIINPDTGIFEFKPFINNSPHNNQLIGKLLGYIAEGIIVRACHESSISNRRWANIARVLKQEYNPFMSLLKKIFYEPFLNNPDEYKAIGTGFAKTAKDYGHLHNPQSDRDICWVKEVNDAIELLSIRGVKLNKQRHAGLQIKVSKNADYVVNYFLRKPFFNIYPVVYFDLADDFYNAKTKLLKIRKGVDRDKLVPEHSLLNRNIVIDGFSDDEIIEAMLIRGKNIEFSLHEELKFYKHILEQIVLGDINLIDINDDNVIISLIIEYLAVKNVKSNNENRESILNLSA
jgi:hypothetical protein